MAMPRSVVPLESNPEVFSKFAQRLGLSKQYAFSDIYSLTDPDLLAFMPRPMKAIILLFPLNEFFESSKSSDIKEDSDTNKPAWFKQSVRNACGLYALIHAMSNNRELLEEGSKLGQFLETHPRSDSKYADDQTDDFIVSISELYNETSALGQTVAPPADEEVDLHFITYIEKNGQVYEMDGRRPNGAKFLGKSLSEDLLDEPLVKNRIQWYMKHATEDMKLNFTLLGLAPSWD
ncbi:LANO_0B04258g1_1 [Lachancea nothofagi CBS 11611]|uniref:Ubiquitin carboxyl-terminal hydrolase n=1 Tax=Lachancea nothofagi CBS 11611 TaxID=1266666 RepID=A0A1G4IXK5_9SACH|nr:LANO_0B04258g1_1 [Lachancea nothofagi CBS 11611]